MKSNILLFLPILLITSVTQAQIPQRYDIVIGEIMSDPTPAVGLPPVEYIEIKNISGRSINLLGWKLKTATSQGANFPNYILPPDSILILCSNASALALSAYGKVIGLNSFPALDNDGSILSLISKEGTTIHAVGYESSWHIDDKIDGGWSLEMIDTQNPCTGSNNWKSSIDNRGGSPGKINSVDAIIADSIAPRLIKTYSPDSISIIAVFDEPVDSLIASNKSNYDISQLNILSAQPQPPFFDRILIRLSTVMQVGTIYELSAKHISDCKGNEIGIFNKAKAGIKENVLVEDIIVNEILFNPKPNAFDFVEFYNRSNKIIDVSGLSIASRTSNGALTQPKKISDVPFFLFPGEYLIVTKDKSSLQHEYLVKNPDQILTCVLPSYPNDKGTVVLTNASGHVIDEVSYSDTWHFPLISIDEGISIERIDPSTKSQEKENWHSASATSGFGTPTYQNSQSNQTGALNAMISTLSKIISPDHDGYEDFLTINYEVETPGYLANVNIFNADGKLVLRFKKNELLGVNGSWQWDGLGENKNKLSEGIYIIHAEIFNLKGRRKIFKNVIILTNRNN